MFAQNAWYTNFPRHLIINREGNRESANSLLSKNIKEIVTHGQTVYRGVLILNVHYWIKRCILSEIFSIKLWRKLTKFYPMTTFLQTMKMKYNFSEIIYRFLGYWKCFAELNDSTPLNRENSSDIDVKYLPTKQII